MRVLKPPILNVLALLLVGVWATVVLFGTFSGNGDSTDVVQVSVAVGTMLGSLFTFAAVIHTKDGGDR